VPNTLRHTDRQTDRQTDTDHTMVQQKLTSAGLTYIHTCRPTSARRAISWTARLKRDVYVTACLR